MNRPVSIREETWSHLWKEMDTLNDYLLYKEIYNSGYKINPDQNRKKLESIIIENPGRFLFRKAKNSSDSFLINTVISDLDEVEFLIKTMNGSEVVLKRLYDGLEKEITKEELISMIRLSDIFDQL